MVIGVAEGSALPRLAFYGVGNYGLEAVRIAAAKGWPIVAAYNRAGAKVGQDLGRLAGLGRDLGVVVEDCETADYAAAGADIAVNAVHDRLRQNMPAYRRLMGAGMNVVCHGAEANFAWGADPEAAEEVDALAKANGVTLTGTGIWDFSRIWAGILVTGPSTEIRSFFHKSVTDAESSTRELAMSCGVSFTQEEFAGRVQDSIGGIYKLIPHHVLHALGYTVTNVREWREPVISDKPVHSHLFEQTFAPGIVIGTRIIAEVETAEGVPATTHIELRILEEGESEHMVWELDGRPATKVRVDRTEPVHTSAACLIHRVPDVIAAPPGIQPISQLGVLKPKHI